MPETDWLTGLSSRGAFARQVRQADRDRDQFAVAIVGIRRIEEINRQLGFDVGDELLRTVGRALGGRIGVGTTIARLGGAQFGMMTVGSAAEDMVCWCEPVVSAVNGALTEWTFEQIDFNGGCLIQPELVMGAAGGFSGRVWADAALALDQAEADADHGPCRSRLIIHDPADRRMIRRRDRAEVNATVEGALDDGAMAVMVQAIEPVGRSDGDRQWLRLVAQNPLTQEPLESTALLPAVAGRLERWLSEQAAALISGHTGQLRITVPVDRNLDTGPAFVERLVPILEGLMVPASRIIIEIDEDALTRSGPRGRSFVESTLDAGLSLTVASCDGGYRTIQAAAAPGIRYIKPALSLARAAANGDPAGRRLLKTLVHMAAEAGHELIAPTTTADDRCLSELGVSHVERPMVAVAAVTASFD